MNPLILYHGDCLDGFSGAYAAWKKFGANAQYIPCRRGEEQIPDVTGKDVYIIDYSFDIKTMQRFLQKAPKVVALDHHVSAESSTKMAKEYVYQLQHSGCVIAWRYFHPKIPVPTFLLHIEDNDLWTFKIPGTKEIVALMGIIDFNFAAWEELVNNFEDPQKQQAHIQRGKDLLLYEQKMVAKLVEGAILAEFEGHRVLVVNSPVVHSDIGHVLSTKHPPFGIIWSEKSGYVRVSLRSDDSVDVAAIAKKYGGGGHTSAAGFRLEMNQPFPWKVVDDHLIG